METGGLPLTDEQRDGIWRHLFRNVMEFVLPTHLSHALVAPGPRLFAWALHGPAVSVGYSSDQDTSTVPDSLVPSLEVTSPPVGGGSTTRKPPKMALTKMRRAPEGSLTFRGGAGSDSRPLHPHELKLLLSEVEDQFILDVYSHHGSRVEVATMPRGELGAVKNRCSPEVYNALQFSVQEITDILLRVRGKKGKKGDSPVAPTPGAGQSSFPAGASRRPPIPLELMDDAQSSFSMSASLRVTDCLKVETQRMFSLMSAAIIEERERRLKALQSANVSLREIRKDPRVTRLKQLSLYNRPTVKPYTVDACRSAVDLAKALHRNAGDVMLLSYGPGAASDVVQNVKLIRPENAPNPLHAIQPAGWDNYCCVRKRDVATRLV